MKLKIDNDTLAEEFFQDTCLLGIVAPLKNYHFCWAINQLLRFDFRLNADMEIVLTKRQRQYFFSIYEYTPVASTITHYLYNNQYEGEYLLPEFKHLDFLWLIKGDVINQNELQELMQTVRSIAGVQLVSAMIAEKIKNKQHLIF